MVQYHRYHHQFCRKGQKHVEEDEESQVLMMECGGSGYFHKRARPKLLSLLIISLLSCSFILAPHLFFNSVSTFSLLCKLFSLMGSLIFLWFSLFFSVFSVLFESWRVFVAFVDSFGDSFADMGANTPLCSSVSNG